MTAPAPAPSASPANVTDKKKRPDPKPRGPLDNAFSPWDLSNITADDAATLLLGSLSEYPQAVLSDWGVLFGWIANQSYAPAPAPCAPKAAPSGTPAHPLSPAVAPKDSGAKKVPAETTAPRKAGAHLDKSAQSHAPGPALPFESIPREQLMSSFLAFVQNRAQEADYRTVRALARLMRAANLEADAPEEDDSAGAPIGGRLTVLALS